MNRISLVASLTLLLLAGCASGQPGTSSPRRDIDRISADEIRGATQNNALELVQDLRPGWRGVVYQDNYRLGGMDELRQISLSRVDWIEYMEAIDAAARFGLAHGSGPAIVVHTR